MENLNILSHREQFLCKLKNKKEISFMKELLIGTKDEIARNPYSGEKCTLKPEAVAIYDFLIGSQISGFKTDECIEKFYIARDIFINNWPEEYMTLLD